MTRRDGGTGGSAMPSSSPRAVIADRRAARGEVVARGAVTSAVTTMLAAISHTVGGGEAPAPTIVVGMIVLLIAPSAVLLAVRPPRAVIGRLFGRSADRVGSAPRLTGVVRISAATAVAQIAFHAAFTLLGAPSGAVMGAAHAHHAHGADALALPAAHAAAEHPAMTASHVAAALVTIAILAYGEAVVARGAAWLRATALAIAPVRPLPAVPRAAAYSEPRIRLSLVWLPATGVRGPPVCS